MVQYSLQIALSTNVITVIQFFMKVKRRRCFTSSVFFRNLRQQKLKISSNVIFKR